MKSQQRTDYWREHITAWQASGLSGQAFCQQHQLTYHQFVYWRQKLRTPKDSLSSGFAKVTAATPLTTHAGELTLALPNGLVLTGFNDHNVALLGAILRQL